MSAFDAAACKTTLFAALLDAKRRFGGDKVIVEDADKQQLTYGRLVLGSFVLGAKLARDTRPGESVGVMLPNVVAMVVTLFGLSAFGRTAALLNFTAGSRNLASAVQTGILRKVVTSRRFIEMAKLDADLAALAETEVTPGKRVEIIYLEDVRGGIGTLDKLVGVVRAFFGDFFHGRYATPADKPAVILFTSGTEGAPKGVALTNTNLVANARQMLEHTSGFLSPADIIMNPLPMFHSFGLTAATLMPVLNGMRVVLYPSPLHYRQVPKLIADSKATVLLATDTFLQGYARAADPGDLDSVRFVIAGAERVKDATRELWAKTGTVLLEGYGATECSPVLAVNLPDANLAGTVGTLLPGIEARLEPVEGISEAGRLVVRGPNVMAGYMLPSAPGTIAPPADGWHDTGDIVTIEDGFISIRGRAKRFAKIGGEMVSLAAVESLAAGLWPDAQHVVINLPDARKGEQLVLVTDKPDADKEGLIAYAKKQGFAELWVPRAVLVVSAIPVLGSGKVDYPATCEMARQSRPLL